jgi:hypothetical protein
MGDEEMSELQRRERRAMVGDRGAVLSMVSALRGYRNAVDFIRGQRDASGAVDAASVKAFLAMVEIVEAGD